MLFAPAVVIVDSSYFDNWFFGAVIWKPLYLLQCVLFVIHIITSWKCSKILILFCFYFFMLNEQATKSW